MTNLRKGPVSVRPEGLHDGSSARTLSEATRFSTARIKELVAKLEVPFATSFLVWRVMNTSSDGRRGRLAPSADPRAYTDRLNAIFTPAGWTRRYTVITSATFERSDDKKLVAKVFVTCDLTIFGVGSHSATGEEWADDDNAGTSAEAQAFKRACSCFGLGRYLYSFQGIWVDLDDEGHPLETPQVAGWATPKGWREGLRPPEVESETEVGTTIIRKPSSRRSTADRRLSPEQMQIVNEIQNMADALGRRLYRGILKSVAQVWYPDQIRETSLLERVLASMKDAEKQLRRLEEASTSVRPEGLKQVLTALNLRSADRVDNLELLGRLVAAVEEKAGSSAG